MRQVFGECWFDETGCKEGLAHLGAYRKTWNERAGCWSDTPRHDIHSESADSFRQFAQMVEKLNKPTLDTPKVEVIPSVNHWNRRR